MIIRCFLGLSVFDPKLLARFLGHLMVCHSYRGVCFNAMMLSCCQGDDNDGQHRGMCWSAG